MTRNLKMINTPTWALANFSWLEQVRNTIFGMNVYNDKLFNTTKWQFSPFLSYLRKTNRCGDTHTHTHHTHHTHTHTHTTTTTTTTRKIRYGVASHLLNVCTSATCKTEYLQAQLIEHVLVREGEDVDKVLWEREKHW